MKRKYVMGVLVGLVLCLSVGSLCYPKVLPMASRTADYRIVLDPGHGGMDGGAESRDGTCEKDINLAIAKYLKAQLEADGVQVVLTREKDEGLYDPSAQGTIRSLKTQDMKVRKERIDAAGADLTVSIHLNSFTQDSRVKGAQVFYPSEGDEIFVQRSKKAAELMQKFLNQGINGDAPRTELGKNDVFLLKNISGPIVIAECGFLSNPEDAASLKTVPHQKKISRILEKSIMQYLHSCEE